MLFVVATPIGNLGDLAPRALETLKAVAAICAEDTRHTRQLLTARQLALGSPKLSSRIAPHVAEPLTLLSSGPPEALRSAVRRWLGLNLPVRESR